MLISVGIVFSYQQVFDSLYYCSLCTLAVIFLLSCPVNLNDFDILLVLTFNKNNKTTKQLDNLSTMAIFQLFFPANKTTTEPL